MATASVCSICSEEKGEMNLVGKKGMKTLLRAASYKNENTLTERLKDHQNMNKPVYVHNECRRKLNDLRKANDEPERKRLRSSIDAPFNWKTCCFLCAKPVAKNKEKFHQVQTLPLYNNVIDCARTRKDDWGEAVMTRLGATNDLVADEAIYHSSCMASFKLNKVERNVVGRPEDPIMTDAFERICEWLENTADSELYSVQELYEKMLKDNEGVGYCLKTFRTKLKKKYEDHVYFVKSSGCKGELVCFKNMANYILRNLKEEGRATKESVVKAAAKIVKEEIREFNYNKEFYPNVEGILEGEKWIPESLNRFMTLLVPSKQKQLSLSQCIIQATRPRSVIAPIPFGVAVNIDKSTGCKQLIQHFSRLGFSITPDELSRFKQSVVKHDKDESEVPEDIIDGFAQWVSDNVDHNIATLTGKGTFHGMGIIRIEKKKTGTFGNVPRLRNRLPVESLANNCGIEIVPYQQSSKIRKFKFDPISSIMATSFGSDNKNMSTLDLLWQTSWFLTSPEEPRPNWSGFLQCSTSKLPQRGSHSSIIFLPIIDLDPSNESCIFSTLLYIISQAKKLKVHTPCVTFDQPLWLKAFNIIRTENLQIVCRLGGFHTLMSFLGSIGTLMKGSGLEDLFGEVYADNSVTHMFTGKAIARATRAHILAESALMTLLMEEIKEQNDKIDFEDLRQYYHLAYKGKLDEDSLNTLVSSDSIKQIDDDIFLLKSQLKETSRTSKLWLLYMDYIKIAKEFIYAERTSNWEMQLQVLSKMLNLFAATGHINYAKSARLYLQEMKKLPETHPWLYNEFISGNHTVQRTKRNWTGIWTDLAIEQTMMRSIKSRGGLTGGRGMTESVRHLWALSLSQMAEIHDAMLQLTGVSAKCSEQHEEIGKSRTSQDYKDCQKFLEWLTGRNPFHVPDEDLYSLSTGLVSSKGKDDVNCELAEEVGKKIQNGLCNLSYEVATIKRKDQLTNLESLQSGKKTKIQEEMADPSMMFNRLITIAAREEDLDPIFEYELTYEPMSLFKRGMMRKPDKPSLRKAVMSDEDAIQKENIEQPRSYILDGGALLHRVRWFKGTKFNSVFDVYTKYIQRNYKGNVTVVFDGYQDEGTKSHEHLRRNSIPQSTKVDIHEENPVPFTQDRFLSNTENKASFINFLSRHLLQVGYSTINCPGDADSTVVKTALEKADNDQGGKVTVVADDTDIAVMLVHHWQSHMSDVYFLQERWNKAWSIKKVSSKCEKIKQHLLFVHAWSGCDTVSSVFGKGKVKLVETIIKEQWQQLSEVISSPWSNQNEVGNASIKAFNLLYGGKDGTTLAKLRHNKYIDLACKGTISPEKLPPTERAAYYHGLRAHYQIMLWSLIDDFEIQATEWGWKLNNGVITPIMTDREFAPDSLTKIIRCNCKTTTKNPCGSNTCTCRKYGIRCLRFCGECRGTECTNSQGVEIDDEDEGDEELEGNETRDETESERNIFECFLDL